MNSFIKFVTLNNLGVIQCDKDFKSLTTIGCGGKIKVLYYPSDTSSLALAFSYICEHNIRYFILGNGSNVLASDMLFNGVVVCLKKMPYSYEVIDDKITISAFYPTINLAYDLALKELGDFSYLGGIPGLLGGAIYNNGGAFNSNISDSLISLRYINTSGNIIELLKEECAFGYRNSIFHYIPGIIIDAKFNVKKMNTNEKLEEYKKKRMLSQPQNAKSMGSIFKNNPLIPAWQIVDALRLRGVRIGDALVSSKHSNFILNVKNAKSSDVLRIIQIIKNRSRLEFGIQLVEEVTIV